MKKIIARIPSESKVHIVFVRKLQSKYFKNKEPELKNNISFCVVKCANNGYLNLCNINGLPSLESFNRDNSILVVFFEIQ
jgi:hypothetical protein